MRTILTHPDAALRQVSHAVQNFDAHLRALCDEMKQLMADGPGGVGIAAPQLGEQARVIVVDCSLGQRPCRHHGQLVMVNPMIEEHSGSVLGREGCLSVPDWVAMVPRAKTVHVSYQNELGMYQSLSATAFEARVIQHELDHLDGILFIDRVLSTHDLVRRMG